jgi:putative transposase
VGNLDYKQFSERRRPHIQPPEGILFLTFRLAGSIAKSAVREYKAKKEWLEGQLRRVTAMAEVERTPELEQWLARIDRHNREWFLKCEEILHRAKSGPTWMQDERVADKVAENLHRLDGKAYRLDAFSVMSNHVHTVFKPFGETNLREPFDDDQLSVLIDDHPGLAKIMHSLKGRSARECNLLLQRTGPFWEHESFDHVIRSGKFDKTIRYVLNNPVKVGLVRDWEDWRWNYCRKELVDRFKVPKK